MSTPWLGGTTSPAALATGTDLPQTVGYRLKRTLLGAPLTRSDLKHERLSKRIALGVLSSDCISSSAYGSEEMLIVLLPAFGVAGFTILMPLTVVVLVVLTIVTLSYRDVVSVYTKTGGSYVVARDNFGPTVAQVAAVALMIDYVVTVAVQSAAGTAALTSAVPALGPPLDGRLPLVITVGVVLLLFYGNLRGIREAGRTFAFPTYFFVVSMMVVIVIGIVRELLGDLPRAPLDPKNVPYPIGHGHQMLAFVAVFALLKAFANGGSSLTGLEAISNGVSVFRRPEGTNARHTLVTMSVILGTLVLGVSWLAHETHARPYELGFPTVISQVSKVVLGPSVAGHTAYLLASLATMLILYTGANTPFNGFPFLTSFVAEDQFLPRQLTRRGHRLTFSNGIIVLAVLSITLLVATGGSVNSLVAFYAIGVFTGFTFAGFGMAKHFLNDRVGRWREKVAINALSGTVSFLVVLIFAVVKFREGAWLVIIIFPLGVLALVRLNRQYRREAAILSRLRPDITSARSISRHNLVVLVDEVDLATIGAIRYGRSLKPNDVRAVHFVIDNAHAEQVREAWSEQPALRDVPLYLVDCPDRRLARAALEYTARVSGEPGTEVTLLLPRRTYAPILGRLLHDRTADEIASAVSRLPDVVATIVPFDVNGAIAERALRARAEALREQEATVVVGGVAADGEADAATSPARRGLPVTGELDSPAAAGRTPIGDLAFRTRATVEGEVRSVRVAPLSGAPSLEVEVWDETGGVTLVFYGRRSIGGVEAGTRLRATGFVGEARGHLAVANPFYELLSED